MSKASGSIDLKGLKVAGEPNKYITKITGDGIKVHDSQNQTNNYIQITSAVIEVYKGTNSVASFGETVNIGKYKEHGDKKIVIGPSGFKIMLVNSSETDGSTSTILEETVLAEIATLNLSTDPFATYYSFGRRKEGSDIGSGSIAEGVFVTASGVTSHAEGMATSAIGDYSHAEGNTTSAIGDYSHAEGVRTIASGHGSHTQNKETIALEDYQTVIGKYNAATVSGEGTTSSPYEYSDVGDYAFIIGNGTDNTTAARSNALTVDWNGNVVIPNNSAYKSKNLSGDERRLCYISTTNGYIYGYDSYVNNESGSYLYGNTIGIRSKGAINIGQAADNNTIAITGATSITGGLNITGQYQRHGNTYIITDTRSEDDVTVYGTNSSNNSYTTITIDIEKDGYTPIAVVSYNFQNATHSGANSSYIMCYGCTFETTNDTASVKVRNLHTANAKIKANVRVLYRAQ